LPSVFLEAIFRNQNQGLALQTLDESMGDKHVKATKNVPGASNMGNLMENQAKILLLLLSKDLVL
jgi:hypothetical protein